jgi:hypothetical protein
MFYRTGYDVISVLAVRISNTQYGGVVRLSSTTGKYYFFRSSFDEGGNG